MKQLQVLLRLVLSFSIRSLFRKKHRSVVFQRAMERFVANPAACTTPGNPTLDDLIYGWGNASWSALDEYLAACIQHALTTNGPILECGSGLSTLLVGVIAKTRGVRLWTLEHTPAWASKVQQQLDEYGIDSVNLCLVTQKSYGDFSWYDVPVDQLPSDFALVICDGPPSSATKGGRYGLVPVMRDCLAPGCVILLDDAARGQERAIAQRWEQELGVPSEICGANKPYIKMTVEQKLLGNSKQEPSTKLASDYWSTWQQRVDVEKPTWIDWGEHPFFLSLIYQELFGSKDMSLFDYFKSAHPHFANGKALSLCSGDGFFESQLAKQAVFGEILGVDIAEYRVEKAKQEHASLKNLSFSIADINQGNYGHDVFDVVFAKAALHHIQDLERAFPGMQACLKDKGQLVTIDFFGPTRFQWTEQQLALANHFLRELPEQLRRTNTGQVISNIVRPTVQEMLAIDPSEAARSSELYEYIEKHFHIQQEFNVGGTVFALVFSPEIVNNFNPEDSFHQQLMRKVFDEERMLINSGKLPSDFKFIIAQKR
jgi:ubiquinone/menaquinone biosynthesis C-methylase UbiE